MKDDDGLRYVHCFACTSYEPREYAGLDATVRADEPSVLRLVCRSCDRVVARFRLAVALDPTCRACEGGKPHAH